MKKLLLVESATKIKTIKKFIGDEYHVLSTVGHLKDLPQKKLGVSIDEKKGQITIDYEVLPKKESAIKMIKEALKTVDTVYLATDPDREGEMIAFNAKEIIMAHSKKKDIPCWRVTFNEITQTAVKKGIANPRMLDEKLIQAQQARRVLDRWVGYMVSPILWKKIAKGLSAGRVQSVALKLICLREEEILAFVVEEYWSIHPTFLIGTVVVEANLIVKVPKKIDESKAKQLQESAKKSLWTIKEVKESEKIKKPHPPFITSTLQQEAYYALGFEVQRTMKVAQSLYEGISVGSTTMALITYMRTDSTRIAQEAIQEVRSYIKKAYGAVYLPDTPSVYSKKQGQDAHEAIRPIAVENTPQQLKTKMTDEQWKLYDLIWNRFVSCQMSYAKFKQKQITLVSADESLTARATQSTLLFDGYKKVYEVANDEKEESVSLEEINEKERVLLKECGIKKHLTQPPARYNEASLVKELEQKNIGRPSTYVAILRTIRDRLYTNLDEKKRFVPTDLGNTVAKVLQENFSQFMDVSFTATLEEDLDKIAEGTAERDKILCNFYASFSKDVEKFAEKKISKTVETTTLSCEREGCEGMLVVKMGRNGQFLGCNTFPACTYTTPFRRDEENNIIITPSESAVTMSSELCPDCKKPLCERVGRFGPFVACSGYPACKYIKKTTSVALCPLCHRVPLVKRQWKGRVFWGCSAYPTCKFSVNGVLIEKKCPLCASPFMKENAKEQRKECVNEQCSYQEPL